MRLTWDIDHSTEKVAQTWSPIRRRRKPDAQYNGQIRYSQVWQRWLGRGSFPSYAYVDADPARLNPSVQNIIRTYSDGDYLAGTVLVLAWGGLSRQKQRLLAPGQAAIRRSFERAATSICECRTIEPAWAILGKLGWSNVARSKCLHFLSRALGVTTNPPVPIDNAAMINNLYPRFVEARRQLATSTTTWRHWTWDSYAAYMSAILTWAAEKGWTTTQVENTIFREYWESTHGCE